MSSILYAIKELFYIRWFLWYTIFMSFVDTIREQLEQDIITGVFQPGDRLDEVSLAERFSTSRTPVRETLQRLISSGLSEHHPRRGVFVRRISLYRLVEMFEVMAELEGMCARLAVRRITPEQSNRLAESMVACGEAAKSGDADDYYRANSEFHIIIYEASQNGFLIEQAKALHTRLAPYRRLQLRVRYRIGQSMVEHREVLTAIEEGNSEKAETAAKAHVVIQGEKFSDLVSSFKE
jgi:DNA-binding GntR family transcriptional regulator